MESCTTPPPPLIYLLLGDERRTALALGCDVELVQELATRGGWAERRDAICDARRRPAANGLLSKEDRHRKLLLARTLGELIDRTVRRLNREVKSLPEELGRLRVRDGRPRRSFEPILRLCQAAELVVQHSEWAATANARRPPGLRVEGHLAVACQETLTVIDQIPGFDCLEMVRELLRLPEQPTLEPAMGIEETVKTRMEELKVFFAARFGRGWRPIVSRRMGVNHRHFQRWSYRPPLTLCRSIAAAEKYAESLGWRPGAV